MKPDMLVLHYTGMSDAQGAVRHLLRSRQQSLLALRRARGWPHHPVRGRKSRRAWHAGESSWAGETDINSRSIGIEIANPGHDYGYPDFPRRQIAAVTALCRSIFTRHRIPADRVLGALRHRALRARRIRARNFPGNPCTIPGSGSGSSRRRSSRTAPSSCWATAIRRSRSCRSCSRVTATASQPTGQFRQPHPRRHHGVPAPLPSGPRRRHRRRVDHRDAADASARARRRDQRVGKVTKAQPSSDNSSRAVPAVYLLHDVHLHNVVFLRDSPATTAAHRMGAAHDRLC